MQTQPTAPLTSICIPTFNGARYLGDAIESALGQTATDWELLIVDDGSTDDTLKIVDEFAQSDRRIRVARNDRRKDGVGGPLSEWNALSQLYRMIERIPPSQMVRRKLRALRDRVRGSPPASESN